MALGDLVTADWEMEYQSFAFGGDSDYAVAQIQGLADLPQISSGDRSRLLRHGLHPGDDFLQGRSFSMAIEVYGSDSSDLATNVQSLWSALRPGQDEAALVMQVPGMCNGAKFLSWCRPRRRSAPINREWFYNLPVMQVEWFATDPRLYALTESSQAISLPTSGGGLTFDVTPDIAFGSVSTGGEQVLNNAGTFETSPVFVITGPVTNPKLTNTTTDKVWEYSGTISSGDYLVVDMGVRSVLLNGTASRYSNLTAASEFWDLEPGNNSVQYRASAYTASTATATWRSAWV